LATLKSVLQRYEASSGQKVNLQKSSIFFGKGCQEERKVVLKQVLGVDQEALSERCLGLPTVVGRSKDGCFKHLRERSWEKIGGWKGQGMSKAAREVLIKSVLQAVPAHSMSCFQLSKKMCGQLGSIASRFWWGEEKGKRKVSWISWEKMCVNKREGGMGFRDYETFNQALLAKQGWRLLTKPSSLCARVLKARYFKNCDFLQAPCPGRASATWRGIIHGRELLREGLVWRIGDGTQVSVMKDKWIPRSGAQQPLGHKLEGKAVRVAYLL
jgi:hypothetical protein